MSENCTHDCSSCSSNCSSRKKGKESFLKEAHKKSSIKKVIGIVSGKGGVGKSLTTALLASYAQKQGKSVGIMDADITGPSIPHLFGVTDHATGSEEGIDTVLTPSGMQLMSMNLLLDEATMPVVWRGMVISGTVKDTAGVSGPMTSMASPAANLLRSDRVARPSGVQSSTTAHTCQSLMYRASS